MYSKIFSMLSFAFLLALPLHAAVKPSYGGTLKVSTDLLETLNSTQLFDMSGDEPSPLFPIPFTRTDTSLTLDLRALDPTAQLEVEQAVEKMKDGSHPCHWVLDYPYYSHKHPTSIEFREGQLTLKSAEPDFLRAILSSSCLLPEDFRFVDTFYKTQFAYEANPSCLAGRPFINSIIGVSVDPANPYLYFKLGDADVIPVAESRFAQISKDPDAAILPGPRFYVYVKTSNLSDSQVNALLGMLNFPEMAGAVLNGHTQILFSQATSVQQPGSGLAVHFTIPREDPYRLLGERMEIQWAQSGIKVEHGPSINGAATIELSVAQIQEGDLDLFRYLLLKNDPSAKPDEPWYDLWDELEGAGKWVPLFIYTSSIAARKSIRDLRIRPDGIPDFSNCWIPAP